ncbi:unnamed protein product, partial [Ectocarpus fasciculatus]
SLNCLTLRVVSDMACRCRTHDTGDGFLNHPSALSCEKFPRCCFRRLYYCVNGTQALAVLPASLVGCNILSRHSSSDHDFVSICPQTPGSCCAWAVSNGPAAPKDTKKKTWRKICP